MVIAWSSFLFTDIIATAPRDNIFVHKGRDEAKGLPISRHQKCKMALSFIFGLFSHFSPFVPAHWQPLDPDSAFIDRNVITKC